MSGRTGLWGLTPLSRDRISVDLRGLRASLLDQARARGVTLSDLVRGVLAAALGAVDSHQRLLGSATHRSLASGRVRLSLRLTAEQARAITLAAKAAGHSTGDFVSGLVAGVPVLSAGANRTDHLAALIASSAEISTLSRNATFIINFDTSPALIGTARFGHDRTRSMTTARARHRADAAVNPVAFEWLVASLVMGPGTRDVNLLKDYNEQTATRCPLDQGHLHLCNLGTVGRREIHS